MGEDKFCSSCGEKIWYSDVFCMRCGEANPFFRLEVFKAEHDGRDISEEMAKEGCKSGHPDIQEDIEGEDLEVYLEYPYCSICGSNLVEASVNN